MTKPEQIEQISGARAVVYDIGARSLVRATGADRVRFLQGMLSNDVGALGPGTYCSALLLDRKGHVLADLEVLADEGELLLDAASERGDLLVATLERYRIADDVVLERDPAIWRAIAVEGPDAPSAVRRAQGVTPAPGRFEVSGPTGILWRSGGHVTAEGVRALGTQHAIAELESSLGLTRLDPEQAEWLRIDALRPAFGRELTERSFPQEARLERQFVSFRKGCYVGQEIVARIQSRGGVNRLLVKLASEKPLRPGAEIRVGGRGIGHVTSAAVHEELGARALGYVKPEEAIAGCEVEVDGAPAVIATEGSAPG